MLPQRGTWGKSEVLMNLWITDELQCWVGVTELNLLHLEKRKPRLGDRNPLTWQVGPCWGYQQAGETKTSATNESSHVNYFCKKWSVCSYGSRENPRPPGCRNNSQPAPENDLPWHHHGLSGRGCALQKWGKVSYSEDNIVRHRKSVSKACVSRKLLCTAIHGHLHCTRLLDNLRLGGGASCAGQGQCRE